MQAQNRGEYHEYVHRLVKAGWDNLKDLDNYMARGVASQDLVVSMLDIDDSFQLRRWPDIHDEAILKKFLEEASREGIKVRLYMAEQQGGISPGVMEAFESSLELDPRFFQDVLARNKYLLRPSEQHRATFIGIQFMIPKSWLLGKTDKDSFRVSVYIKRDDVGNGWTGQFQSISLMLVLLIYVYRGEEVGGRMGLQV